MANKGSKKGKKPLKTTLGQAPSQHENDTDLSHIRKPMETSVFGLGQVLSLFQTATDEVKNYVTYECDIMYECRICRTIFRSLANFILHKRNFCREKFYPVDHFNNNDIPQPQEHIIPVPKTTASTPEKADQRKSLNQIIEKLEEKQQINQLAVQALNEDLSENVENEEASAAIGKLNESKKSHNVILEKIETSNTAVFQTLLSNISKEVDSKPEFMKSEVMEIHDILDSDEVVLGPDGKICNFYTNKLKENSVSQNNLYCIECDQQFSTKKTLTYHIKCKHNQSRLVYICPNCKDTFANPWCVYRHLLKVHRMTNKQIRRIRNQVHNSCIRKDQEPTTKKKKQEENSEEKEKGDEENQWLNNLEGDNDFQMCGGCGKRFERKAALHSHSTMCAKRIAVCNAIKETNAKKKEEESTDKKLQKHEKEDVLKGALKRKPKLLTVYERKPVKEDASKATEEIIQIKEESNEEEVSNDTKSMLHIIVSDNRVSPSKKEDNTEKEQIIQNEEHYEPNKDKPSKGCSSQTKRLSIIDEIIELKSETCGKPIEKSINCKEENEVELLSDVTISTVSFEMFCKKVEEKINTTECKEEKTEDVDGVLKRLLSSNPRNKIKKPKETLVNHQEKNGEDSDNDLICISENLKAIVNKKENNVPSSRYRIRVSSLEDLIGVSPENHKRNLDLFTNSNEELYFQPDDIKNISTDSDTGFPGFSNEEQTLIRRNIFYEENSIPTDKEYLLALELKKNKEIKEIILENDEKVRNKNQSKGENLGEVAEVPLLYKNEKVKTEFEATIRKTINEEPASEDTSHATALDQKIQENEETKSLVQYTKRAKRKRGISFEDRPKKLSKPQEKANVNTNYDISFISRASPYMDQEKLLCLSCNKAFHTFFLLLWHMSAHFSWFRFQCTKCSFISFNKHDCMAHAKKQHKIKCTDLSGVVLPIPNWKTVLMAHEFCLLQDENDLSGKHTDENIIGNPEEDLSNTSEHIIKKIIEETEDPLFTDYATNVEEDYLVISSRLIGKKCIKDEVIDIMDEDTRNSQILHICEDSVIPVNVSDIIKNTINEEELGVTVLNFESSPVQLEVHDEDSEDYFIPQEKTPDKLIDFEIKKENIEIPKENCDCFVDITKSNIENNEVIEVPVSVNVRPARNRIKTEKNDFYYDLSNVVKLSNDSVKPKGSNNLSKPKKNNNTLKNMKVYAGKSGQIFQKKK